MPLEESKMNRFLSACLLFLVASPPFIAGWFVGMIWGALRGGLSAGYSGTEPLR